MKYYIVICIFFLFSCASENQKIQGKIVDKNGKPIFQVLVQVMGTDLFAYSDEEGYFAINTKSRGTELIFNKEGYQLGRQEIQKDEIMQVQLVAIPMKLEINGGSTIKPD